MIREVCGHCGLYRERDTWAQDPQTGEQGLQSVSYQEADADSLAWVEARRARAAAEAGQCTACSAAGMETTAAETVEITCPHCGAMREALVCEECAEEARTAPHEARWCDECRKSASMAGW